MAFNEGHALIIGVRSHIFSPDNDVPVTYNDAKEVYNILIDPLKCGYLPDQVMFLHDETATAKRIADELDKLAVNAKAEDTVFVFFAGHGAFGADKNYSLATHDVKFVDTGDLELKIEAGTGLSQAALLAKFKQLQARRVMFVFNACHSGSLQPQAKALGGAKPAPKALGKSLPSVTASALLSTGTGRIVISACLPDQLSNYYPSADLTFFTTALTAGLQGEATPRKGYISAFSLYTYVYETVVDVAKSAGVRQDPMITVLEGVGPFPVALSAAIPKGLSPLAAESLPVNNAVRRVTKQESEKWLTKIETQTIVEGDYVTGDQIVVDKVITIGKIDAGNLAFGNQLIDQRGANIHVGDRTSIDTGGAAYVRGSVHTGGGDFVGRDKITVQQGIGGAELTRALAPVLRAVQQAGGDDATRVAAQQALAELQQELAEGKNADDSRIAGMLDGLANLVPAAIAAVVSAFGTPLLAGIAGPVTQFVLAQLRRRQG